MKHLSPRQEPPPHETSPADVAAAMNCPTPGIYPDVPDHVYHSWDAVSASLLACLDESPIACQEQRTNPREATPAMELGTAAHAMILEPATFAARYAIGGPINPTTGKPFGSDTKKFSEWAEAQGRPCLSLTQAEAVYGMARAVESHPQAAGVLAICPERELSIVWDDPATGLRCKGRIDALGRKENVLGDLKTTSSVQPERFQKSLYDFGAWRQIPFYIRGLAAHDIIISEPLIVAVESEKPHDVTVFRITDDVLELGNRDADRLLAIYANCLAANRWPRSHETEIVSLSLPAWAVREADAKA